MDIGLVGGGRELAVLNEIMTLEDGMIGLGNLGR